jgi:hypothetical protein
MKTNIENLGTVEGLSNDELADPHELERQVLRNEFEILLCLPKPKSARYNPAWDSSADIDFNAFGSVDFQRTQQEFNKAKYKIDKLKEQLKDLLILIYIVNDRIHSKAKYKILKLVKHGIIDVDTISDWDMWQLARMYVRALSIRRQIKELQDSSKYRREQRLNKWLDSLV